MARKKPVVGPDLTPDWLEKRCNIIGELDKQLIRGLRQPGQGLTLDDLQSVVEHCNPFGVPTDSDLMVSTTKNLRKFFGRSVEVHPLPPEFTPDNLSMWAGFNLKPIFLPNEEIGENRHLKGWTKPGSWFYQQIREGKIAPDSAQLHGGWYLADFTVGVDYTDGTQVFPNDPLTPIISRLREEGKVGKHDNTPTGSRFTITHYEWQTQVLPAFASHLGFNPNQVRLERAIEFNAIGNLYDPNRGKFNMWEWFADKFEVSFRLRGGSRESGGLASVPSGWSGSRGDDVAGRPLVSFVRSFDPEGSQTLNG